MQINWTAVCKINFDKLSIGIPTVANTIIYAMKRKKSYSNLSSVPRITTGFYLVLSLLILMIAYIPETCFFQLQYASRIT